MNNVTENKPKRPIILWILGILTMLDSGFSFFAYIGWALKPGYMRNSMESIRSMGIISSDQLDEVLAIYDSIQSWQYLLLAAVSLMLFLGAFLMLAKLKKTGFHIYTIGKILEFCVMNFAIGGMVAMDISGIIMSILWVLMFAMQLRYMEPFENQDNNITSQNISNPSSDNNPSHE